VKGRPWSGQIGILGPVELMGEEPVPLGGVKERCLVAALAVHCGAEVSAASLRSANGGRLGGWMPCMRPAGRP
jgi:hypothetical protein